MNILDNHRHKGGGKKAAARNDTTNFPLMRKMADVDALGHHTEEDLRKTEALLKGILESTADGILAVDGKGKVIHVNRRFTELWKIPQALVESGAEEVLLDFVLSQVNDPEAFLNKVKSLYATVAQDIDVLTFKDGRVIERYSQPMLADGSIVGRVWSFRDITRLKQIENALQESVEQFRSLVEQAMTGILVIQNNRLAFVNPRFCEIHGYAKQNELVGTRPLSLIAKKDRCATLEKLRPLLKGEVDKISQELTALRKDGTTIEIGVGCSRANYRGWPAIFSMTQDITEKKRVEEENRRYVEQLKAACTSTVEVATIINEMRDPYTAGHERRVADIAVAIGSELGYDENRQEGLHIAGHLHDIGKINVPSEILSKPGKLSKLEYQLIQEHARASYDVLKGVDFPWPVAQVALQHHERLDGTGYPQGFRGNDILHEARIMAVADVVEAISSHRPYRAALGIKVALDEIERGRGTAYDGDVVDVCLRLFRNHGYQLPV